LNGRKELIKSRSFVPAPATNLWLTFFIPIQARNLATRFADRVKLINLAIIQ